MNILFDLKEMEMEIGFAFLLAFSCCLWNVQSQNLEITANGTNVAGETNFQLSCTLNHTLKSEVLGPMLSTENPLYAVDLFTNNQVLTIKFSKLSLSHTGNYTCAGYYFFNDSATCSHLYSLVKSYNVEIESMTTIHITIYMINLYSSRFFNDFL